MAEYCQVTFARYRCQEAKGWISFSLTSFLPWFWHLSLFLRLWRTSQQYKPTPKKFKDGANLLFRGLIIANTYASSMRSRVSYRFLKSIYRIRMDRRKRYDLTSGREVFWKRRKIVAFSNEYGYVWTGPEWLLRRQRNKKDIILV